MIELQNGGRQGGDGDREHDTDYSGIGQDAGNAAGE